VHVFTRSEFYSLAIVHALFDSYNSMIYLQKIYAPYIYIYKSHHMTLAEVKLLQHGNPLSTTLTGLAKYLCQPPLVEVPRWQTGAKALCLYNQSPQACKTVCWALTWLTIALMEWNALHITLAPGACQTLSATIPVLDHHKLSLVLFMTNVNISYCDL